MLRLKIGLADGISHPAESNLCHTAAKTTTLKGRWEVSKEYPNSFDEGGRKPMTNDEIKLIFSLWSGFSFIVGFMIGRIWR